MDFFKKIGDAMGKAVTTVTRDKEVQSWLNSIDDAEKRERDWRKSAQKVVELFEYQKSVEDSDEVEYNILYANTETLSPAVYNNTPRPVVKRRVDKENPVAVAAAQVLKAVLVYLTDNPDQRKEPFDELMKSAVQEALVPGRGLVRYTYDAEVDDADPEMPQVKYECVHGKAVPWNRVVHGYGKSWSDVPWRAYEHFMTEEECKKNFGGKKIKLTHTSSSDDEKDKATDAPQDSQGMKFAHIWEVWDKRTKTIIFVSEGYDSIIDRRADPLKLQGFFDSPRPMTFFTRISSLQPKSLYETYQSQAEELERCTRRIKHILSMMKVRGFYDGTIEGLDELLKKPEGTLLPAGNVAALQQGQTLEKSIWFMPLAELITVLQQLYQSRLEIINTIHQLTGIADIMRGATQASETLGAQEMKQAWGTMRLKRMQKEVQRFARDSYRLQAELAANHFGIDTLQQMTGVQLIRTADKQSAQMELDSIQQQGMAMQMQGQAPDPALAQRAQKAQETLKLVAWEEVLQFLRNDPLRNYVIDVETNSTIDIEATEDKAELSEMMNSMSQLMNGVFPMVKEGVLPFPAAKALMLSVVNKFRLGDEVEEVFRAMQAPQEKPDPAVMKVQAEMERDKQKAAQDMQMEQERMRMEQQQQQEEMQLKQMENQILREKLQMEAEFNQAQHQIKMQQLQAQLIMKTTPAAKDPNAAAPGQGGEGGQSAGA
jgi:hypothetical protein